MLQNIKITPKVYVNQNNDSIISKNIIDILFESINENLKRDRKTNAFTKALISSQLPNIRDGSKKFVDDMNPMSTKKLLEDIQNQLNTRK